MAGNIPIFDYRYLPYQQTQKTAVDGGFSLSLWDSNELLYREFSVTGMLTREERFPVPAEVIRSCRMILTVNGYWTRSLLKNRLLNFQGPMPNYHTNLYLENIDSHIQMNDLEQLMAAPFRTYNSHYSRLYFSLLEDFAAVLYRLGFNFTINDFSWAGQQEQPVPQYPVQTEQWDQQQYGT